MKIHSIIITINLIRPTFLLLFFLATSFAYSQKNQYLDERNGFKIFTFGDSKEYYDGMIGAKAPYLTFGYNTEGYKYIKSEPYELYGAEWNELLLGFTRRKLTNIRVKWKFSRNTYSGLKKALTEIFGEPEESNSKMSNSYVWRGDKVIMILSRESDEFIDEAKREGLLDDFDLSVTLKIENRKLKGTILYDKKKGF